MDLLPPEIQAEIIRCADIPIDTFLHYANAVGAVPKKLLIPEEQRELIGSVYVERQKRYANKKKLEAETNGYYSDFLVYFNKIFDRENRIQILIDEDRNTKQIKLAFRAMKTTYEDEESPEMFTIRKTVCDVQTGEPTEDWMGDSDEDSDFE